MFHGIYNEVQAQVVYWSYDRTVEGSFESACVKLECELIEMDGEQDYVHLLFSYPPKLSISVISNTTAKKHAPYKAEQKLRPMVLFILCCTAGGATIETLKLMWKVNRPQIKTQSSILWSELLVQGNLSRTRWVTGADDSPTSHQKNSIRVKIK